jgi:hypothetical protein
MPATAPRVVHCPVIDVTTMPQGWLAFTGARHYSNLYSTYRAFSSKAPLGFFVDLGPPLEPIKEEDEELSRGRRSQAILHLSLS